MHKVLGWRSTGNIIHIPDIEITASSCGELQACTLISSIMIWALLLLLLSPLSSNAKLALEPGPSHGPRRTNWSSTAAAAATEARKELLQLRPVQGQATAGTTSPMTATLQGLLETFTYHPVQMSGSRPGDYFWTKLPFYQNPPGVAWMFARDGASRDPASYGAVSRTVPAAPYWNQRVLFRALVEVAGLSGASQAALFVRVMGDSSSLRAGPGGPQLQGPTMLVFDNMSRQKRQGWTVRNDWWTVVVDVPGPPHAPGDDSCPPEGAVPTSIQFGVMLSGGTGRVKVEQAVFQAVGKEFVALTSDGMPPWEPPGPDFL